MALDARKRAGEDEATRAAVFVRIDTASKDTSLAKVVFYRMRSYTDHMVHRELRSGSGMVGLWISQSLVHGITAFVLGVNGSHRSELIHVGGHVR